MLKKFFILVLVVAWLLFGWPPIWQNPRIPPDVKKIRAQDASWLSGWSKRVKITIDAGDVDADLSNLPVLVYLSASSGINSEDVSFVFDELESDANRKKIAVTTDDGETECYVEIEEWDDANEQAWLWVKIPSIDDTSNTDFYLYYDSTHADNTSYVGDPGSTPGRSVWDTNFKMVQHMNDITTSTIQDSTINENHGTKEAANQPAEADGKINKAQSFGATNFIALSDSATWTWTPITQDRTLSLWFYPTVIPTSGANPFQFIVTSIAPGNRYSFFFYQTGSGTYLVCILQDNAWNPTSYFVAPWSPTLNTWYHITIVASSASNNKVYVNGSSVSIAQEIWLDNTESNPTGTGIKDLYGSSTGEGRIDEMHFSHTIRSAAWIKASYETERDHLLDWGSEEDVPVISVTITSPTPSEIDYGVMAMNATKDSVTITAEVGNTATELNIKGANATYEELGKCGDGTCTWTLASSISENDEYVHAFTKSLALSSGEALGSNPDSEWVALNISGNQVLSASVEADGSQNFKLDMRTPYAGGTETDLGSQYSTEVVVLASTPD